MTGPTLVLAMSTPVPAQVPAQPTAEPGAAPATTEGAAPTSRGGGGRVHVDDEVATPAPLFADLLLAPPVPLPVQPPTGQGTVAAAGSPAQPAPLAPGQLLAMLDGRHAGGATVPGLEAATPAGLAGTGTAGLPLAGGAPDIGPLSAPDPGTATASLAAALEAADTTATPAFPLPADVAAGPLPEAAMQAPDGIAAVADGPDTVLAATQPAPAPRVAAPAPQLPPMAMPAQPADGFDEGLGARIAWMAEQRLGHAEIRLNPEHVGRIDVRIELDGHQVRAEFSSAHAEVRQAIEASLPRLREMLGQHGLQLGQADVGQYRDQQPGAAGGRGQASGGRAGGDDSAPVADAPATPSPVRMRGLVDAYA